MPEVFDGDRKNVRWPEPKWLKNQETGQVVPVGDMFTYNQCYNETIEYLYANGWRKVEPIYREATPEEVEAHKKQAAVEIAKRNRQCAEDRIRSAGVVISAETLKQELPRDEIRKGK